MKLYMATWFEDSGGKNLTTAGISHRLLSYHGLRLNPYYGQNLRRYKMTGIIPLQREKEKKNASKQG